MNERGGGKRRLEGQEEIDGLTTSTFTHFAFEALI